MRNLFKKKWFAVFAAVVVVLSLSGMVAVVHAQGNVSQKDLARMRTDIKEVAGKGVANAGKLEKLTQDVNDLTKKVDTLNEVNDKILSIVQTALGVVAVFVFVNFLGSSYLYRRDKEQTQKDTDDILVKAIAGFSQQSLAKVTELVDAKFRTVETEVEKININILLTEREEYFAKGIYQNALTRDVDILRAARSKGIGGFILDNALSRIEADLIKIMEEKNEDGLTDTTATSIMGDLQELPPKYDVARDSIKRLLEETRTKRIVSRLPVAKPERN